MGCTALASSQGQEGRDTLSLKSHNLFGVRRNKENTNFLLALSYELWHGDALLPCGLGLADIQRAAEKLEDGHSDHHPHHKSSPSN